MNSVGEVFSCLQRVHAKLLVYHTVLEASTTDCKDFATELHSWTSLKERSKTIGSTGAVHPNPLGSSSANKKLAQSYCNTTASLPDRLREFTKVFQDDFDPTPGAAIGSKAPVCGEKRSTGRRRQSCVLWTHPSSQFRVWWWKVHRLSP